MYSLSEIESLVQKGVYSLDLNGDPKELYDPIGYIISIGGKRIRPTLCLLTYSLFSDNINDSVMFPALALEIFHAFTLIHDDIMDKADLRRGQVTIHKKWNDNIAILSGDVMSIKSYQYICRTSTDKLEPVLSLFSKTAAQVCEGQQYDMNFEKEQIITVEDYIKMIGLKTAVFLACAAKMGALLAGAPEKAAHTLYDYGYQLGIAFQITDDYLDVYGNPNVFGKNIGGDIVNNKKSWLLVESQHRAYGEQKVRLESIMGMDETCSEEKIAAMQQFYEDLGIKRAAETEIEKYYLSAMESTKKLGLDEDKLTLLEDFATMITHRKK